MFSHRDIEGAKAVLHRAIEHATNYGLYNSDTSSIYNGLGAIALSEGDYSAALAHGMRAVEIREHIGDLVGRLPILTNLTLAYFRLGKYQDSRRVAESVLTKWKYPGMECQIQATYSYAMSSAMMGLHSEALESLDRQQSRLPSQMRTSVLHKWLFYKADVLMVCGREREAIQAGLNATSGDLKELSSPNIAGPYARWTAVSAKPGPDRQAALSTLDSLVDRIGTFDRIDQTEIMASRLWLGRRLGSYDGLLQERLDMNLKALPGPVRDCLLRLRLLD
jgi:tetratricopeptide (TPR) repeat protein